MRNKGEFLLEEYHHLVYSSECLIRVGLTIVHLLSNKENLSLAFQAYEYLRPIMMKTLQNYLKYELLHL